MEEQMNDPPSPFDAQSLCDEEMQDAGAGADRGKSGGDGDVVIISNESDSENATGIDASKRKGGRHRTSVVYKSYRKDSQKRRWFCKAPSCKFNALASSTNLANHLKKHPVLYKNFLQRKAESEAIEASQKRIDSTFSADGKTIAKRPRKDNTAACNEALAELVGATTMSFNSVDRPEFKLYTALVAKTPDYKPPCRQTMVKEVRRFTDRLRQKVLLAIGSAKSIAISGDICTTKGMARSYIAFTAHFYLPSLKQFVSCLLDVVEMTDRHTGAYIKQLCDDVLEKYDIPFAKVSRYVIDNGANMVSAFSEDVFELDPNDVRDQLQPISEIDANLEDEADDDDPDLQLQLVEQFSRICRCFAHNLQLTLRNVFNENEDVQDMLKCVMKLLNRFNKSHVATRTLIEKTGLKLLFPAMTRWSSHGIVLGRLIIVLPAVNEICLERKWQPLRENAELIDAANELVKPFLEITNFMQGDKYVTISEVYFTLEMILDRLEEPSEADKAKFDLLGNLPANLARRIRTRFAYVLDWDSIHWDPTYLAAATLDPNNFFRLSAEAQKRGIETVTAMIRAKAADGQVAVVIVAQQHTPLANSASSRLEMKRMQQASLASNRPEEAEAQNYCRLYSHRPDLLPIDVASFWSSREQEYATFSSLAFEILAIPATSAAVERVFSQLNLCTVGHKNRSGPDLVRDQCFMRYNKVFKSL